MRTLGTKIGVQVSLAVIGISEAFGADTHVSHGGENHQGASHDAQNAVHDIAHGAAHDAAHSGGGLPQLDPTWYASQLFWLALTFATLYIIFSKNILPSLSRTIENRREQVDGDLENAREMKEEAERVYNAYEEALAEARVKANETFAKAEAKIKEKAAAKLTELREKSAKDMDAAEANLAKAKTSALKDMDSIAAEVASAAAEKIVGISTDIKQAKSVVENINKKAA